MDTAQTVVLALLDFDDARFITENFVEVKRGSNVGIFSVLKQQVVVPVQYNSVLWLTDDLFRVSDGFFAGVFSVKKQDLSVPMAYLDLMWITDDLYWVKFRHTWALFELEKKEQPACSYEQVHLLDGGMYLVSQLCYRRFFSAKKKDYVSDWLDRATHISDTKLFYVGRGELCGVFSLEQEKVVVPVGFNEVTRITDTVFRVRNGDKVGIYSTVTQGLIVPLNYDHVQRCTDTLYSVTHRGRWGFYRCAGSNSAVYWKAG